MSIRTQLSLLCTAFSIFFSPLSASENTESTWIHDYIVTTPDFPKPGIQFISYGPLLKDPRAFKEMIQLFAQRYRDSGIDAVLGLDARGFIFGVALANELNLPFVMVRKAGKLPGDVEQISYELEYGKNTLEIDKTSLNPGDNVIVVDDLLATGGTARATCDLVERLGAKVAEVAVMVELLPLGGREKIGLPVFSLITIEVDE